jgi:hypothetical protein
MTTIGDLDGVCRGRPRLPRPLPDENYLVVPSAGRHTRLPIEAAIGSVAAADVGGHGGWLISSNRIFLPPQSIDGVISTSRSWPRYAKQSHITTDAFESSGALRKPP